MGCTRVLGGYGGMESTSALGCGDSACGTKMPGGPGGVGGTGILEYGRCWYAKTVYTFDNEDMANKYACSAS